ncbi:hypothetical protein KCU81_g838, partial [Aureobasidium melanogenum]
MLTVKRIGCVSAPQACPFLSFLLGLHLRLDFRIPEVVGTIDDDASQPLDRELGDVELTLVLHQRSHDLGDTSLDDVDVVLQDFLALAAHGKVLVETTLDLAGQVALTAVEETGVDVMAAEFVVVGGVLAHMTIECHANPGEDVLGIVDSANGIGLGLASNRRLLDAWWIVGADALLDSCGGQGQVDREWNVLWVR